MIEQAPSALQLISERFMENTRNKFVIPSTAPYGQAYLLYVRFRALRTLLEKSPVFSNMWLGMIFFNGTLGLGLRRLAVPPTNRIQT